MARPRRIRVSESKHYVKFRLAEDGAACRDEIPHRAEINPPLLAWVARARLLGAMTR